MPILQNLVKSSKFEAVNTDFFHDSFPTKLIRSSYGLFNSFHYSEQALIWSMVLYATTVTILSTNQITVIQFGCAKIMR